MTHFRREVSNRAPVISVRGDVSEDPKNSIINMLGALPETIRDKVTMTFVTYPYKPSETAIEKVDRFLSMADEYDVECSYSCAGWNSNILGNEGECCPPELIDRYLSEHPSLKFVEICEHACCGGMTKARRDFVCSLLEICHRHGAYFVWKDMSYQTMPNPFSEIGDDNHVFDTIKKYGNNLILVNKHNGIAKYYLNHSLCLGYWLSDLIGNWGVNAEFFLNFESGMHELFKKPVGWRHKHSPIEHLSSVISKSCHTMPSVGFLQQYLPAVASGAVFYSLEDMCALVKDDRQSAIYTECMLPFYEKLLYDNIIPSKECYGKGKSCISHVRY